MEIIIINLICFVIGLWIGKLTKQTIIKKPVPMPYYVQKNKTIKYSKGGYKFNRNGTPLDRNGQNVMKNTL